MTPPTVTDVIQSPGALVIEEVNRDFAQDCEMWERQPWESPIDWAWFQHYRDSDPEVRSTTNTYRTGGKEPKPKAKRATNYIQNVSSSNHWVARSIAFDKYTDHLITVELLNRRLQARKELANLGRSMRRKAGEAVAELEAVIYEYETVVEVDPETGEEFEVERKTLRSGLSATAIVKLAEVGAKIETIGLYGIESQSNRAMVGVQVGVNVGGIAGPTSDREILERATEILEASKRIQIETVQFIDIIPDP